MWRWMLICARISLCTFLAWALWCTFQLSTNIHTAELTSSGLYSYAKLLNPNSQWFDRESAEKPGVQMRQTERKLYGWGEPLESSAISLSSIQTQLFTAEGLIFSSFILCAIANNKVLQKDLSVSKDLVSAPLSSILP